MAPSIFRPVRAWRSARLLLALLCGAWLLAPSAAAQPMDTPWTSPDVIGPEALSAVPPDGLDGPSARSFQELLGRMDTATRHDPPPPGNATGAPEPAGAESPQRALVPSAPSRIETLYRQRYRSSLADALTQFGYDLFGRRSRAAPATAVPGPDYRLGPGDLLRVRLWGAGADASYSVPLAPDGTADVPRLGVLPLAGLGLDRAEDLLESRAAEYLRGVRVRLTLERLRSMEVYVVGEVNAPGLHVLPAFSTVLDALAAAEGVRKSGSLRRIRLVRRGENDRPVDLYQLLLRGSREGDAALRDRDVVFVPRLGPTAAVAGAAAQAGIYELSGPTDLAGLLALAGGELPQGHTGRVHLRRYRDNRAFSVLDLEAAARPERPGTGLPPDIAATRVLDGDLLELAYIDPQWTDAVRLTGHVRREDVFAWRPGLSLAQVLTGPDLLRPEAVTDYALLHRYDRATTRWTRRAFPLGRVLAGLRDEPLLPMDRIEVLSRHDLGIEEPVLLKGAVWRQGNFTHAPGMSLLDLLALGGGLRFGADAERIQVSRKALEGETAVTRHHRVSLRQAPAFALLPWDYVFVPQAKDAEAFRTVAVRGEVRFPGEYRLRAGEHLSDLLERAGGFTEDAYFYGARFYSPRARDIQQESVDLAIRELEVRTAQALGEPGLSGSGDPERDAALVQAARSRAGNLLRRLRAIQVRGRVAIQLTALESFRGSAHDFRMEHGDELVVPSMPNFVSVMGSVYSPSAYLFRSGKTLEHYLDKSGGPTDTAKADHMYLLRANGEVVSRAQDGMGRGDFLDITPMPGDTLVVPEDLERVPAMQYMTNVTDILFKIATTAGVVLAVL